MRKIRNNRKKSSYDFLITENYLLEEGLVISTDVLYLHEANCIGLSITCRDKMRDYIPVEIWKNSYKPPFFTFVERVPISKIKIDKKLFAWQNKINISQVDFIAKNFDIDFWMPIIINSAYYLLDGQHRLRVSKKLILKYIDVVIKN